MLLLSFVAPIAGWPIPSAQPIELGASFLQEAGQTLDPGPSICFGGKAG